MTDTAPTEPTDTGPDTAEHPIADALAERLEGGPPPATDPPAEVADSHIPPLDRLEDYERLNVDDPRRVEAARILAGDAPPPPPEGE